MQAAWLGAGDEHRTTRWVDPRGDVVNDRELGASWQAIADRTGIIRQAAYQRWAELAPR